MQCPYCGSDSQVVDSRVTSDGVRRRRSCNRCKRRFTTYERVSAPGLRVIKRSDKTELFDSDKIVRALRRVCRHRTGMGEDVFQRIARSIEAELLDSGAKTVRTGQIAALALARLAEIDRVSYNRLAANYIDEDGQLRPDSRKITAEEAAQLGLFESDAD